MQVRPCTSFKKCRSRPSKKRRWTKSTWCWMMTTRQGEARVTLVLKKVEELWGLMCLTNQERTKMCREFQKQRNSLPSRIRFMEETLKQTRWNKLIKGLESSRRKLWNRNNIWWWIEISKKSQHTKERRKIDRPSHQEQLVLQQLPKLEVLTQVRLPPELDNVELDHLPKALNHVR